MYPYASGKAFRSRHVLTSVLVGIPAAGVVMLYLLTLLHMTGSQWREFLLALLAFTAVITPLGQWFQRRMDRHIAECIDRDVAGESTEEDVRRAYAQAARLPVREPIWSASNWVIAGVLVPIWMRTRDVDTTAFAAWVIFVSAASGALGASIFSYFSMRRLVQPLRDVWAGRIQDPELRRSLNIRMPVARKIAIPMAIIAATLVVFVLLFSYVRADRVIEKRDTQVKSALLGSIMEQIRGDQLPDLTAPRARAVRDFVADHLVYLDRKTGAVVDGPKDVLSKGEVRWILSHLAETTGNSTGYDSSHVFSWVDLGPRYGRILAAVSSADDIGGIGKASELVSLLVLLGGVGFSLTVAWLIARDVSRMTEHLRERAERIAAGDLRPVSFVESDDELGALARSFEGMGDSLRATVKRVEVAAEGVDGAAVALSEVGRSVSGATADQVSGIEQATSSMASINRQVSGITESAQVLNGNVEEASSSVLELGAAGEELNQTASALNGQVEEVSSSIEQMIRSVSQIGENTEGLARAVADTSSSMAEMAGSMREVDANASETARLSSRVVDLAESGRQRVQQTISGMEAIREATDTASEVIGSLGGRVQEIGAIVDVIDDVADETNLLALNAAIIAAQAGEQGRAFSVVADEIKDLADRVLSSTKEIGGLIRAVQTETANATTAIGRGSESVQGGVDLSAEAGVSLEEITAAARDSGARIQEIVQAVREQSRATNHVTELMERVNARVEEIRAAGREQERGNEVVMRGSLVMRDVAQQTHRTTEEQARGAARIRDSIESVRDAVDKIHASLQEQSEACRAAVSFLEQVFTRTRSNEDSTRRLSEASQQLKEQAEALRTDVRRFRTA